MFNRLLNPLNLVPLCIVPVFLWSYELIIHLLVSSFFSNPQIWITLVTLGMPICGYLIISRHYRMYKNKMSHLLPPEILGIIGFLYSQPIVYLIIRKSILNGFNAISLKEDMASVLILTATVPLSTMTLSTYTGSLVAVPLSCLSMVIAGFRGRRKYVTRQKANR